MLPWEVNYSILYSYESQYLILIGYDWKDLPDGSLIVDVGGGNGAQIMAIARAFPNLRFVVQDLELIHDGTVQVCLSTIRCIEFL
jgi:tRNA G46 methylase TrmB